MMTKTSNDSYHTPVLLQQSIEGLITNKEGQYVDVTYGGGGHSSLILEKIGNNSSLFAFDQDQDVKDHLTKDDRLVFIPENFEFFSNHLRLNGIKEVDGILADLGVSSRQFDNAKRGFSFRYDAALDMRMDKNANLTAEKIINEYQEDDLYSIFRKYGEVKSLKRLVEAILSQRESKRIKTTFDLLDLLKSIEGKERGSKFYAKVFQALRIEVNQEIKVLESFLNQCAKTIKKGGRLVIISYHSLEDRLVKNFIKSGNTEGKQEKDFYGNLIRPFKEINRKPIIPNEQEIEQNNRARSAKMRIAERI